MIKTIQRFLREMLVDSWVIYDYCCNNPVFKKVVGNVFTTRKAYLIIRQEGTPVLICHAIDRDGLNKVDLCKSFSFMTYKTWQELDEILHRVLGKNETIMMEISENGELPRSSYVDYGTVNYVKGFVKKIVSSADLFQRIIATFDGESLKWHKKAATTLDSIKDEAFALIAKEIREKGITDEYSIQEFIVRRFKEEGMITDSRPIVAVGKNAGSPHYEPTADVHSPIRKGDIVLIDLWAKYDRSDAVYADITWMGYVGTNVPDEYTRAFNVVKTAIDMALDFLEKELPRRSVCGYEVDDICNHYISSMGYDKCILHRTGHSISLGDSDHGVGVNIDNFETHDTREIIDRVAFSLEPAIYTEGFGIREEIDVYISNRKPYVYTPRQKEILKLS